MAEQVRKGAFFKARSAKLSKPGRGRLSVMASAIPAQARDVLVSVVGVSLSKPTPGANLRLAAKRANRLIDKLAGLGVKGTYTMTLHIEGKIAPNGSRTVRVLRYDSDGTLIADTTVPAMSATGRALSTATATFTVTRTW